MNKLLTLILLVCIAFSCSSNDSSENSSNNTTQTGLKLTGIKVERIDVDWSSTTSFFYENGVVSKIEYSEHGSRSFVDEIDFNYENNQLIGLTYHKDIFKDEKTYTYTGGLVTRIYSEYVIDWLNTNCVYNSNKQLIRKEKTDSCSPNCTTGRIYEYDGQGNIYKISTIPFNSSTYPVHNTYHSYDNKKNPYSLIYSEAVFKVQTSNLLDIYSKNNPIKATLNIDTNKEIVYNYTYNDSDFPVERIHIINGESKYKTTYTYQ